jgi:hypothetical protein
MTTTIDTTAKIREAMTTEYLDSQTRKFQAMTIPEIKEFIEKNLPIDTRSKGWKAFNKTQLIGDVMAWMSGEFDEGVFTAQKARMTYEISDEVAEQNRQIVGAFNGILEIWLNWDEAKVAEVMASVDEAGHTNFGLRKGFTRAEYFTQVGIILGYYVERGLRHDETPVITDFSHLPDWVAWWPEKAKVVEATPAVTEDFPKIKASIEELKASKPKTAAIQKPQNENQAEFIKSLLTQLDAARATGDKALQKKIRVALRKAGHYISRQD